MANPKRLVRKALPNKFEVWVTKKGPGAKATWYKQKKDAKRRRRTVKVGKKVFKV